MAKSVSAGAIATGKTDHKAKRGVFITFEGGEGAGKSSQIRKLAELLEKFGNHVLETREPGGSDGAEAIRHVLLSGAAEPLGAEMETLLFFAARSDNVETIIKPALDDQKIVLCDRFYDSTRVYQGKAGKVPEAMIERLIKVTCQGAVPDLTIILDIDPKIGLARVLQRDKKGADRFEKDDLALQNARRQGFLRIARDEPERCRVIDAGLGEDKVFSMIEEAVVERYPQLFARPAGKKPAKPAKAANARSKTAKAAKADTTKTGATKAKPAKPKATRAAATKATTAKAKTTAAKATTSKATGAKVTSKASAKKTATGTTSRKARKK